MKDLFKNTHALFNRKNFIWLIFGLLVFMVLMVSFNEKYLAEYAARYLFFILIAFVLSPVIIKIWISITKTKQTFENFYLSVSLKFQNISKEKYESLLGPKLLREPLGI